MSTARFANHCVDARLLPPCAALAFALVLGGCGHRQHQGSTAPYVSTAVASYGTIQPVVQLAGIIAPYENVAIQTTLVEPTDSVNVQEGDFVRKGEVLAQLDTADLEAELSADEANAAHTIYQGGLSISQGVDTLRQAEVTLRTDQINLERDETLFRQGYVARQMVDAQLETVRNDQQTVAADQANVSANGTLNTNGLQASAVAQAQAQAEQVRVSIAKATIYSPIDGVVVNRNLNPGEYPGNRQIFTLQQVNPIYAIVQGSGAQIAYIRPGVRASVLVSDLGQQHVAGTVVGVLNQIVPGSTNFMVKVVVANAQYKMRPGMTVQVGISLPVLRGVRVPMTAFTDQNHTQIMTVDSQSVVQVAKVTEIGNDGSTSVVSGIQPGTRVVANGMASVGSGEKVSAH